MAMPDVNPPPSPVTALDWAIYYARRGWSVVPVRPGEKMPAIPWARLQSTPADEMTIRGWFDAAPTLGIGLVQGRHVGTIVLDFDASSGGMETLASLEAKGLPQSARAFTPGGGVHVVLTHPGVHVPTRKGVLPGMDVRGDGGFVVAAPSVHVNGRRYAWDVDAHPDESPLADVPAWLLPSICGPVSASPDAPAAVTRIAAPGTLGIPTERVVDGRETYMRDTIMAVMRDLRDSLGRLPTDAELIEAAWPQYSARVDFTRPGRGQHEFAAKVRYTLARARQGQISGFAAEQGEEAKAEEPRPTGEAWDEAPAKPKPRTLPLVYFGDVRPSLDASDFVEGVLTDGAMSVVYGPSNCGKTFFVSDLGMHVATGTAWRGRAIEAGGVIYCALEGGHGISNRVAAWRQHHRLEGTEVPFAVIPVTINLLDPKADRQALVDTIAEAAATMGAKVKLTVIDTLSRAMAGGNENAPDDMGALVASADMVRQETGSHVCFIHHSGKDDARGARGHSLLRAATDTEIEISRQDSNAPSVARVTKQREMEIEGEFVFTLDPVTLGTNRRGKPVTSCIVVPSDAPAPVRQPRKASLPAGAQIGLMALSDALGAVGRLRHVSGLPSNTASVGEDEWRRSYYAKCPDDTQDAKKRAFARAVTALQSREVVGLVNGFAWIVADAGRSV